jgi:protein SCO1/2
MNRPKNFFAVLVALFGLAGSVALLSVIWPDRPAELQKATVLPVPQPLPDFDLSDETGRPFTRSSLLGGWHLLFFGFTHCPDICPATLQQIAIARARLEELGTAELPEIVLVSVDPERDTAGVLANYVTHFGNAVHGVSGDTAEVARLARALGIYFEKSPLPDGDYTMAHSAAILAINEKAELSAIFSAPHDTDVFVNDIPLVMTRH